MTLSVPLGLGLGLPPSGALRRPRSHLTQLLLRLTGSRQVQGGLGATRATLGTGWAWMGAWVWL